jgi:hypothetical protein
MLAAAGAEPAVALNGGYHLAFALGAAFAAIAALLGILLLKVRTPAADSHNAHGPETVARDPAAG